MIFYLSRKPRRTFLRFTHFTTLVILCLIILSFPSSIFVKADEDPQPCTVTNETTNKYYDLSSLTKTEGGDWIVYGYGTGWTFYMNVCHGVLYRDKNDDVSEFQDIGVYGVNPEYYKFEKDHNIGQISNEPLIRGDKLIMEFSNGKKCGTTNYRSTSVVSFICDKTVEGQGQPIFISSFEDCAFLFEWRTPAACPTDKIDASKGGWGVFFTIFIIALIVYFVGGIIYNRMVHNAIGMHQIPNWEFWSNACDFLKDMIVIIFAQCPVFNKPRRHGGRNYRNLPRDEENILIEEEFEEH